MRPDGPRDPVVGPDSGPSPPFPVKLQGPVVKGFGRGSKELGIPTANIPPGGLTTYPSLDTGVYYGLVGLEIDEQCRPCRGEGKLYEAVLSIGFNPFYGNQERSIEIHILSTFTSDFYGTPLNLLILGFVRPEYDYVSREALIDDIRTDCNVARRSLRRPAYEVFKERGEQENGNGREEGTWLRNFEWVTQATQATGEGDQERL